MYCVSLIVTSVGCLVSNYPRACERHLAYMLCIDNCLHEGAAIPPVTVDKSNCFHHRFCTRPQSSIVNIARCRCGVSKHVCHKPRNAVTLVTSSGNNALFAILGELG